MASRAAARRRRWAAALAAGCGALWPSSAGADATPVIVTTTQTAVGVALCQSACVQVVNVENLSLVIVYVGAPPAPASIRLTPLALDFGAVRTGGPGPVRAVRVLNTGPTPVVISGTRVSGLDAHDFSVRATTCLPAAALAGILQPRTGCAVQVGFVPAAPGRRDATLTMTVNQIPYSVGLSGRGARPGALSATPATVDFGPGTVGGAGVVRALRLRNLGESPLRILGLTIGGDYKLTSDCLRGGSATPLAPGAGCTMRVRFSPAATGTRPGALTVNNDAPGGPIVVPLTGRGIRPIAEPVPGAVSFGGVPIGQSSQRRIELDNPGTDPLSINGIRATSSEFKVGTTCPPSLPPGGRCPIDVVVTPLQPGALHADLVVDDNAAGSPQRVTLSAFGQAVEVVHHATGLTALVASPNVVPAPVTPTASPNATATARPTASPQATPTATTGSHPSENGAPAPIARVARPRPARIASTQTPEPAAAPGQVALPMPQPVNHRADVLNTRLASAATGSPAAATAATGVAAPAALWALALVLSIGAAATTWWRRRLIRARRFCGLLRR
jgi:hypothetical protein